MGYGLGKLEGKTWHDGLPDYRSNLRAVTGDARIVTVNSNCTLTSSTWIGTEPPRCCIKRATESPMKNRFWLRRESRWAIRKD